MPYRLNRATGSANPLATRFGTVPEAGPIRGIFPFAVLLLLGLVTLGVLLVARVVVPWSVLV